MRIWQCILFCSRSRKPCFVGNTVYTATPSLTISFVTQYMSSKAAMNSSLFCHSKLTDHMCPKASVPTNAGNQGQKKQNWPHQCCLSLQGGDLRHALGGPHHAALSWYKLGAQIALDVIKGLHFLHSHNVRLPKCTERATENRTLLYTQTCGSTTLKSTVHIHQVQQLQLYSCGVSVQSNSMSSWLILKF